MQPESQLALDFSADAYQVELPFVEELFGRKDLQDKALMQRAGLKSRKLLDMIRHGCKCPLCGQFMKQYARTINGEMATALILAYRHFTKYPHSEPLHMDNWLDEMWNRGILKHRLRGRNHALLTRWNLLETTGARESKSEKRKVVANYRITKIGMDFVEEKIAIPKYVYLYDNRVLGYSDAVVMIKGCIGKAFNYEELISAEVL